MTRPDLVLTGAIEGLLLSGSPVNVDFLGLAVPGIYTAPDTRPANQRNGPHLVVPVDCWPDDFNGTSKMIRSCKSEEVTLDLTHPLGLATALRYLKERGHDGSRFAARPDALAWCILSVSRGGPMLGGVIVGIAYMDGVGCACVEGGGVVGGTARRGSGWYAQHPGKERSGPFDSMSAAEDAFAAAALAASYALLNDDGLQLPTLPVV